MTQVLQEVKTWITFYEEIHNEQQIGKNLIAAVKQRAVQKNQSHLLIQPQESWEMKHAASIIGYSVATCYNAHLHIKIEQRFSNGSA